MRTANRALSWLLCACLQQHFPISSPGQNLLLPCAFAVLTTAEFLMAFSVSSMYDTKGTEAYKDSTFHHLSPRRTQGISLHRQQPQWDSSAITSGRSNHLGRQAMGPACSYFILMRAGKSQVFTQKEEAPATRGYLLLCTR